MKKLLFLLVIIITMASCACDSGKRNEVYSHEDLVANSTGLLDFGSFTDRGEGWSNRYVYTFIDQEGHVIDYYSKVRRDYLKKAHTYGTYKPTGNNNDNGSYVEPIRDVEEW